MNDRLGCMSDWADNYDELATTDDGTCDRLGCMSDWADNYDPNATINDTTCFKEGCMEIGQIIMILKPQPMMAL